MKRHTCNGVHLPQVLNAKVFRFDTFGRALGIKHLMLQLPTVRCGRLSPAISVLEQLQTLWLADPTKPALQQTYGALQLSTLTALVTVALDGVVPESIERVEGCELHVTHYHAWAAEHTVWGTALHHLRSVAVSDRRYVVAALPSCLLGANSLARVSLLVHRFGTAAARLPLKGALAQAGELVVQCKDLHATVPADVDWRKLSLAARNLLDLQFEDVASFGSDIPMLCLRYGVLPVCSP